MPCEPLSVTHRPAPSWLRHVASSSITIMVDEFIRARACVRECIYLGEAHRGRSWYSIVEASHCCHTVRLCRAVAASVQCVLGGRQGAWQASPS